jgi:HJR/Mrr/RecB family endonuclease
VVLLPASLATQASTSDVIAICSLILLLGFAVVSVLVFIKYRKAQVLRSALRTLTLENIDTIDWLEFERYVAELFRTRGYKVHDTALSNDFGVDLVAKRDDVTYAVQIKHYKGTLDQKPVREAVAGMAKYRCNKSMVVTNSYFTKSARTLAESNKCQLVDRDALAKWVAEFKKSAA